MARQSQTPVQFARTTRSDDGILMTSARAGKVVPVGYVPILRGDSASGRVGIDIDLAEMPRPLLNGVTANFQAWFVPKSAHPQFSGSDEFMHAYQGETIKALGQPDRQPPSFFNSMGAGGAGAPYKYSEFSRTLGLHFQTSEQVRYNHDLFDAFSLIYNFRLAAHSSRLPRRSYASEDLVEATKLPRAFWPSGRFSRVVPDYERALIVGSMDLDVLEGRLPVSGIGIVNSTTSISPMHANEVVRDTDGNTVYQRGGNTDWSEMRFRSVGNTLAEARPQIFAEMEGQQIGITLADIDKARTTQAFAKLRTAYAGNDATGFDNDDAIVAELMQGFRVPEDQFKRPWLLDSSRVPFGMVERHATDAANLDASVSRGRASATLSLNVPQTEAGGLIIFTVEVLPERLDERQHDEWLAITEPSQLPDALRDVQRPDTVDVVLNRRLDAKHTNPNAIYGYEPMNDVWNRAYTRLGGSFYQDNPLNPWTEQRSAIWQTSIVDPEFTSDHFLAPEEFPHDVFSDTTAHAFEVVSRHSVKINGLTQIGDVLAENNDDYAAISNEE